MDIYYLTQEFPKDEIYGLTSQMRRAFYSIPYNIAKGYGRESDAEFKRSLTISQGSASALESFTILAKDLNYIKKSDFLTIYDKVDRIRKSLNSLINKI